MEKFSREQCTEAGSLPLAGNDQPDLRDVITPAVTLEVQRPVGHDLVIVHHHKALDPASVELGGTSFHHPATGHVNSKIFAIFFGEGTKKLVRAFDIGRAHAPYRHLPSILQR
jgi:hypothetical protein